MNIVIVLAAGNGERFGEKIPKQYVKINDRPVICYTLYNLQNNKFVDAIEIVVGEDYIEYLNLLCKEYNFNKVKWIIKGGETFQKSVYLGILNIEDKCKDNDNIMLQCAVSPNTSDEIIEDSFKVCSVHGNAVSAESMIFPLCQKINDEYGMIGIEKDKIVSMNGPWTFNAKFIIYLYHKAIEDEILDYIESHTTSLLMYYKYPIFFSKGDNTNIKITTKKDLELFKALLLIK